MALLPSRTKYRKVHKGRIYGTAQTCNTLAFGEFGIQSLTQQRYKTRQGQTFTKLGKKIFSRCEYLELHTLGRT